MLTNQMVMKDIMLYAYAVSKMYFCFFLAFFLCICCLSLPLSKICSLWSFFFLLNIMQNFACQKKSYTHTYTIPYQSTGPFQPRPLYDSMILWNHVIHGHILMSSLHCVKPRNTQFWKCISVSRQTMPDFHHG